MLTLELNDRPFQAIKKKTKKVEVRTPRDLSDTRYIHLNIGDSIVFINNITNKEMVCKVLFITWYKTVKELLETEGTKNVLSSGLDVEGGIKSIHSLEGYEERIKSLGVFAIGIEEV